MQTIGNPNRGCGNLIEGGCYLQASFSSQGDLLPVTWTLGHNVYGGKNLSARVPPRENIFIDPEMTIEHGDLVHYKEGQAMRMAGEYTGSDRPQLVRLGEMALIDHVGMNNYTAWSFAQELMRYGPSRKIAPKLAKQIADMLPMRIFFTADLPIFETADQRDDFIRANELKMHEQNGFEPTWTMPTWGARLSQMDTDESVAMKSGSWHYDLPILKYLDTEKDWLDLKPVESIYCFSWITKVYYIVPEGGDESDVPSDILAAGIEPVRAAQKGKVVE